MLAISPLRSNQDGNKREGNITNMDSSNFYLTTTTNDEFPDFWGVNLLESIDFDDLFMGMHNMVGLPDLEMDPEFSLSGGEEESSTNMSSDDNNINNNNVVSPNSVFDGHEIIENNMNDDNNEVYESLKLENCDKGGLMDNNKILEDVEIQSYKKKDSGSESNTTLNSSSFIEKDKGHKKHKSSSISKIGNNNNNNNNQGKRKTKVDWTPELHRRFVQAVEQLGVDKAVPSRILELMGIDCLTRHNIASHLQKYRSHRKHLLTREAEAASWTQKRQMYGVAMGGSGKGGANISQWPHPHSHSHPPTIGFPPQPPMTTMHHPFSRPLHVWGHPSMDPQIRMPVWPKQVAPLTSAPVPPAWTPHPPPPDPAFWLLSHRRRLPIPRSVAPVPVPGILPSAMYRPEQVSPPPTTHSGSATSIDPHPSKESVNAALEDVLAKPWLPLPIGLKPPSMDSVFVELHRRGISKIPPSSSTKKKNLKPI